MVAGLVDFFSGDWSAARRRTTGCCCSEAMFIETNPIPSRPRSA
jgi:hypothetical protein